MPFSHHSHSGQFCNHAKDSLEDIVKEAIAQQIEVFCMTEHMPRDHDEDLYPEELAAGLTPADLHASFAAYMHEANRLREKYRDQIAILVGTETDWIRPRTCLQTIETLFSTYEFDVVVGSVHHVHTVPIDFSKELYQKAVSLSVRKAGREDQDGEALLAADYFDLQLTMLQALKPPVVGHFDLIRLYGDFDKDGSTLKEWPEVWQKVRRNLSFIREYGGCLEINSAGLRKGLKDPYPCRDVCELFLSLDGRFVLSDDSHGIAQVGHSYSGVIDFVASVGIQEVSVFVRKASSEAGRSGLRATASKTCSVDAIRKSGFMKKLA